MKQLVVIPDGWPCLLIECPPGLFVFGDTLCIKTEYGGDPSYIARSGEAFWGGEADKEKRENLIVQPCKHEWQEVEL